MKQRPLFPAKPLPVGLEAAFEAFWKAYPPRRPNPRLEAAFAFAKALKHHATAEQLIAAAAAYAAEVVAKGTKEEFIVHARTFLSKGRYLDYLPDPEAAAPAPAAAEPEHPLWARLQGHVDLPTFHAWIGKCEVEDETHLVVTLKAPSHFVAQHIAAEFRPLLERALGKNVMILGKAKA